MMSFRYFRWVILFSLLVALTSCNGRGGADDMSADHEILSDSLADASRLSDTVQAPQPEKQLLSFATSDEAIEYMRNSPNSAKYMVGVLPRMAHDELSYCTRLLNNSHDGFIVVDKDRMKVILFDKFGVERFSYGMCCAKNYGTKHKKADSRTPEGFFEVEGIYDSTDWLFTDDNGVQSKKKGQFGPRFIRLKIPVTSQIGIHGTCAPWSIGGRSSHGCIRITNENILQLVKLVSPGMPVIISPGRKDIAVNLREGYNIPAVSTVPGREPVSAKETQDYIEKKDSLKENVQENESINTSDVIESDPSTSVENDRTHSRQQEPKTEPSSPEETPEVNPSDPLFL